MKHSMTVALLIFGFAAAAEAQSFDTASIKSGDTTDPRRIRGGGCRGADNPGFLSAGPIVVGMGRCRFIGATLRTLTAAAYSLEVTGGPRWADSDHFEVEGVAPNISTATRAELNTMLRQLLADRFKLSFHRETKEISGYALTVAKSGSKLKPADGSASRPGSTTQPGQFEGRAIGVSAVAFALSRSLGVPVTDETGIKGQYNITLKWSPDELAAARGAAPADPSGPSIFTAVQEQLGLRLEPRKTSVEILAVDSAEKPDAN
jgi:uncharacterized protein (TIGR03435 family)